MADINSRITADPSQFVSALQQADAAVKRLSQSVAQGGAPFASLSKEMREIVAAINPAARSLQDLERQLGAVRSASTRLGEAQATTLLNQVGDKASLAYWKSQTEALDAMSVSTGNASKAADGLKLANAGVAREVIVLGHEMVSGNFSRIPGSIMVLGERMGGLGSIFQYVTATSVSLTAGIAAVGAVLAYVVYQAYEASRALEDTNNHIGLLGQSAQVSRGTIESWQDSFRTRFNETASQTREVTKYVDQLGGAFTNQIPRVMALVAAYAELNHLNLTEATKAFEKQFGTTTESFLKGAQALGIINPELAAHVEELNKAHDESQAAGIEVDALNERFGKQGGIVRETKAAIMEYMMALAAMGEGGAMAAPSEAGGGTVLGPGGRLLSYPKGPTKIGDEGSELGQAQAEIQRLSQAATNRHSPELEKRVGLQRDLNNLITRQAQLEQQLLGGTEYSGGAQNRVDLENELNRVLTTQQNIRTDLSKLHGPAEQEAFKVQQEGFDEEIRRAENNRQKIAEIQSRKSAAESAYYGQGTVEAVKAEDAKTDAVRKSNDQQFQLWTAMMQRRQAEAFKDQDEQVRIQQNIVKAMEARGTPTLQPEQYEAALSRLQSLTNSATQANYQRFAGAHREMIQEANQDFGKIQQIYAEWAAEAARLFGKTSVEFETVQREMVRAAQQAQKEIVREQLSSANSLERINNSFLSTFKSNMELMVKEHKITTEQALGFDIQYTAQLFSQVRARYDAILSSENATRQQKEDAYNKILELDANYTKQVVADQEKIAAAADKTAKQISDSMSKAFSSIGSELEKVIEGALIGKKVTFQSFAASILKSVMGEAATLGSQLIGSKLLAPALGVTVEGGKDSSISAVLGTYFTKMLGMGQKETAEEGVRKSQADLGQVIKTSQTYTDENTKAIRELTQKIADIKGSTAAGVSDRSKSAGDASSGGYGSIGEYGGGQKAAIGAPVDLTGGTGEARFSSSGVSTNTEALQRLTSVLSEGSKSLPEGYRVEATSTTGGKHTEGGFHPTGEAIDVRIVGPSGTIPSRGEDTTGMYQKLAAGSYQANERTYPGTNFTWGGNFGVVPRSQTRDLMHFDAGPDRGSIHPTIPYKTGSSSPYPAPPAAAVESPIPGPRPPPPLAPGPPPIPPPQEEYGPPTSLAAPPPIPPSSSERDKLEGISPDTRKILDEHSSVDDTGFFSRLASTLNPISTASAASVTKMGTLGTSIDKNSSETQQNIAATEQNSQQAQADQAITQQNANDVQQLSSGITQSDLSTSQQKTSTDAQKTSTDQQKSSVDKNTQALDALTQKIDSNTGGSGSGGANPNLASPPGSGGVGPDGLDSLGNYTGNRPDGQYVTTFKGKPSLSSLYTNTGTNAGTGSGSSTTSEFSKGLSTLTQGIGIASSAVALFGGHLSTTARAILGAVGVGSQLLSFGKNISGFSGVLEFFGISTKAASTATAAHTAATSIGTGAKVADTAATHIGTGAKIVDAAATQGVSAAHAAEVGSMIGSATTRALEAGVITESQALRLADSAATVAHTGTISAAGAAESINTLSLIGNSAGISTHSAAVIADYLAMAQNAAAVQVNSAAQASSAASSGIGSIFKAIPIIGALFDQGGVVPSALMGFSVPSAAGGMTVNDGKGGTLAIVHPEEMVLPAPLSRGMQDIINRGLPQGQMPGEVSRATESRTTNNTNNSLVLNYDANVTGHHPYESKSAFESMLRTHGNTIRDHVENALRNGQFGLR